MNNPIDSLSQLVVISGRSGSGKTSLANKIIGLREGVPVTKSWECEKDPKLKIRKPRKYTTRSRRADDDFQEFIYVDEKEFKESFEEGTISVKYKTDGVGNQLYGWSNDELRPRHNELVLAVSGDDSVARDLKYLHGAINVFLDVPLTDLEKRIRARGGTTERLIEERVRGLNKQHRVLAYDVQGREQSIGMDENFYGTPDQVEGIANVIVRNTGNLEAIARAVFNEIVRVAKERTNPLVAPSQRLIYATLEGQMKVEEIKGAEGVRPSGTPYSSEKLVINPSDYSHVLVFGTVVQVDRYLGSPEYFIRLARTDEAINVHAERSVTFRGMALRNIEAWGMRNGDRPWRNKFFTRMYELGMWPSRKVPNGDGGPEIERKADWYNGHTSYRDVRKAFEDTGFVRLI